MSNQMVETIKKVMQELGRGGKAKSKKKRAADDERELKGGERG